MNDKILGFMNEQPSDEGEKKEVKQTTHLHIKLCCNNLIAAIKTQDIIINEGEFCLGRSRYALKEPAEDFDCAIVKIFWCPWCGKMLDEIVAQIKQQISEAERAEKKN
jgi:hypothetical protein